MKKYMVMSTPFDLKESLMHSHFSWGLSIKTVMLAVAHLGYERKFYETREEAAESLTQYEILFEVELKESTRLENAYHEKTNELLNYKTGSKNNIEKIISAAYEAVTCDLTETSLLRDQLIIEAKALGKRRETSTVGSPIRTQIEKLHTLVWSLEGKASYTELLGILHETNLFLEDPSRENLKKYQEFAQTQRGAPSPMMQQLGVCMLAVAAAVVLISAAVIGGLPGVVLMPSISVALVGCGLFAEGKRTMGVCDVMMSIGFVA